MYDGVLRHHRLYRNGTISKRIAAVRCSKIGIQRSKKPQVTVYSSVTVFPLVFLGAHTSQKLDSQVFECNEPPNSKGCVMR